MREQTSNKSIHFTLTKVNNKNPKKGKCIKGN